MWSQSDIKLPIYGRITKLRYYILFLGKVSTGGHNLGRRWPLKCPSLRSGQFGGQKCLAHVEISREKKTLVPAKKNFPHFLNRLQINSWNKVCEALDKLCEKCLTFTETENLTWKILRAKGGRFNIKLTCLTAV